MRVGVIDYGVGNLGSVVRALEELRVSPVLVDRAVDLHAFDCLVLPGVGNFADCMGLLNERDWADTLREEVVAHSQPLLGVCVGMQLLATCGDEGGNGATDGVVPGLGLIPGRVSHLRDQGCELRLPHVGWNAITATSAVDPLLAGIPDDTDFYFVHSYGFVADDPNDVLATTEYGVPITAVVHRDHVWGTQFHPEKSSKAGAQLLRNFIMSPAC